MVHLAQHVAAMERPRSTGRLLADIPVLHCVGRVEPLLLSVVKPVVQFLRRHTARDGQRSLGGNGGALEASLIGTGGVMQILTITGIECAINECTRSDPQPSSGVIFVDGKMDGKILEAIHAACVRAGREDDLLVINPGNQEVVT